MQLSSTLPSANGRAPSGVARVAVEVGNPALAAALVAELALTPGLVSARRGEAPDLVVTDRPEAAGRRMLFIGAGAPSGSEGRRSVLNSDDARLITAAVLLMAEGYRVEPMVSPTAVPASPATLTARERQVAELLVEGASNKVIARRLEISVHTAKFHVAAVLEKLNARNRSDAVAIALRDGLVAL
jgi:DNA-binding CsgD family transcriptional regulator